MHNSPSLANGLVLIIDDTLQNIESLASIVQPDGYEIYSAHNGDVGLELARGRHPDVIMLDLVLPGLMGIEVLEILKQEQPNTTVILTTAYGSEETAIQALRSGANDYIINKRPFDHGEVREVVRRAMAETRLRRENHRRTLELESANHRLQTYAQQLEKAVEDERTANERLKGLDRVKASFLSMISHELRHPLTVAKGYLELIETRSTGAIDGETRRHLRIIGENFDHLSKMIDDLLDLSRIEAGTYQIQRQNTRVLDIMNRALQTFAESARDKGITLASELPDSLPVISADAVRIVQVITNLLHNALKFTPRGGTINVSARASESEIEIAVADTGLGIPPDELARIFDRLYQVRREDSDSSGAGLGLAICREIARLHGGRIWAESEPGRGSRVVFALPRQTAETADSE